METVFHRMVEVAVTGGIASTREVLHRTRDDAALLIIVLTSTRTGQAAASATVKREVRCQRSRQ
jgi:hypothetical protein